jgi:hypothetical protein
MTTNLNGISVFYPESLYKEDFYLWIQATAQLLRSRQLDALDLENLIEEIESMGASQRRELKNRLIVLLMHLLKYQYQQDRRSSSWVSTILEQYNQLESLLEQSPSLKSYYLEVFSDCYNKAVRTASIETKLPVKHFPTESRFTPKDVINFDFIVGLVNQDSD